jgi:hypothetical protein
MSVAPQLKEALQYRIKAQRGPLTGQSFDFEAATIKIGRGTDNELVLNGDLRASRHHAEIRWDGFELQIVNLSQKNFIVVNGEQVQSARLDSGTIVTIGESELRIEFDQESKTQVIAEAEAAEPKTRISTTPLEALSPPEPLPVVLVPKNNSPLQPTGIHGVMMGGAATNTPNYSTNIPGAINNPQMHAPRPRSARPQGRSGVKDNGRLRFYGLIVVVGLIGWWLISSNSAKKKELSFRSTEQIEKDLESSREEIKVFEARREKMDNVQYKRAQENYIRGFRDYKQGNYGRARESFQVVLNLDPDNELAKRYYQLSKLKFDESVKFNMLQGNRYREKKSWRLCKSSYFNVMAMLNNNQDPVFKEAKQYYDQCNLAEEGRF